MNIPPAKSMNRSQWQEVPFFKGDPPVPIPNPNYVTVSEEEAKASTITLQGQDVLNLLHPILVERMTGKYRTQHGNMIQPDV